MIGSDIIKTINNIQNENTEKLSKGIVESAHLFETTLDYKHLIKIITEINAVLLTNGIFLREVLDVIEDIEYPCDNKSK